MTFNEFKTMFLDMTAVTVPYGSEYLYYQGFLRAIIGFDLIKQGENFYHVVGDQEEGNTLFCSHLDTAGSKSSQAVIHSQHNSIISTKNDVLLGADNKAGVLALMYMIYNNVTGTYYFFAGEERGGIGSAQFSNKYDSLIQNYDRAIAFDRRSKGSIITHQMMGRCCSTRFAESLAKQFGNGGVKMSDDPTGTFTDTANFTKQISECTNISIGFDAEHTPNEHINIDYAYAVARAATQVDWEGLPADRDPTSYLDDDLDHYYSDPPYFSRSSGAFSKDGTEYYPPSNSNHTKPMKVPPAPPFVVGKRDLDLNSNLSSGDFLSKEEAIQLQNEEDQRLEEEELREFDELLNPSGGESPPNIL